MEIIIDGYNLIGVDQGLSGPLEHKRRWLVQRLSIFREKKNVQVTVVFDGWQSGSRYEVEKKKPELRFCFRRWERKPTVLLFASRAPRGTGVSL